MHDRSPGDEALMTAVAKGDLSALEELVARHQDRAWRLANRFLGDHGDAQDTVQDAFLRLLTTAS